jgi:uncharacterized phage protein (TIGR02220 family)
MSIRVMTMVWDAFPGGGSELLAMLALADWSDDEGRCWPSMASIAKKTRLSRSQAQRVVHKLIDDGFLAVTGNETGGAPGSTRQYRINLFRLTGSAHATGRIYATGSAHAQEGSRRCGETGSAHATQTVIEPSITVNALSTSQAKVDRMNGKTAKVEEVLSYLNLQAKRNYRGKNPNGKLTANAMIVIQRLKDGYTVEQLKDVVASKSNAWMGDEKMDQYLNPQTLFRKSNFEKYLAEAEAEIARLGAQ